MEKELLVTAEQYDSVIDDVAAFVHRVTSKDVLANKGELEVFPKFVRTLYNNLSLEMLNVF